MGSLLLLAIVALRIEDVPASLRARLPDDTATWLKQIEKTSAQRLRDGEMDHMVHYLLQSTTFTSRPPIEPALSAKEFATSKTVPAAVTNRAEDFLRSRNTGERFRYLRSLVNSEEDILREYHRAMLFLYRKEVDSQKKQGSDRREFIASLYQTRGHSSDTSMDISVTMNAGLEAMQKLRPQWAVRRALVIGPGLDFAPRTSLKEDQPPKSYQPFILADALQQLKLASRDDLSVECVDLNPRVVSYFQQTPFRATLLNILTSRLSEKFDLIVATNVLLYFDDKELLLAMSNIKAMLNTGGVFLHNDLRAETERYGAALGMPIAQARMIRLSEKREIYDAIVLHESR